jgi:hypothetical protein
MREAAFFAPRLYYCGLMKRAFITCIGLVTLIATLFTAGCKQLDLTPDLPAETREGKGTFGCRVNDALWLPYTDHTLDRAIEPEYRPGWFALRAEREQNTAEYFWLQIADSTGLQKKLYSADQGFYAYFETNTNNQYELFVVKPDSASTITLTRVTPPGSSDIRYTIVSGTFSFVAESTTTGKTVTIKDGRFDVKAY